MPAPAPYPSQFPALYLYPLNDSFVPKHISLLHNQRVKIGRQTNAKTTPGERNGYFDSKVLSRQHAEVWEEGNKIFIKDVKSSNGTFINGERLSPEGLESEPFELKSDDIVEFGIDIVGEDNKTIIHHKVAARVVCIFTEQDVQMAARAEQHQMQHLQQQYNQSSSSMSPSSASSSSLMTQAGPSGNISGAGAQGNSSFNFASNQQQRRPQMGHQGLTGMGGMGGSMRPPGKSGLTFDHILSRLQGELQKSRETGAELHTLTGTMNDIHDTLGGGLPANIPPYPHTLPPVRPSQSLHQQPYNGQPEGSSTSGLNQHASAPGSAPEASSTSAVDQSLVSPSSTLLSELQTQLQDTQASLALHVEKVQTLEGVLKEQEAIRHDVRVLREMMDAVRRTGLGQGPGKKRLRLTDEDLRGGFDVEEDEEIGSEDEDMDDARSVSTIVPHELERVEEEDEEQLLASASSDEDHVRPNGIEEELELELMGEEDLAHGRGQDEEHYAEESEVEQEERRRRREELGRPRTPEPSSLGMRDGEEFEPRARSKTLLAARHVGAAVAMTQIPPQATTNDPTVIDDLTARLAALSSQLETAIELSSTLQAQHAAAQSTISTLESKVEALEGLVKVTLSAQQEQQNASAVQASSSEPAAVVIPSGASPESSDHERESLTTMLLEWKKSVEGHWSSVQEEWIQERERLNKAREEWESKVRLVDSGLEKLERMQSQTDARENLFFNGNGDVVKDVPRHRHEGGLATPPSPRSLSADSGRVRRKRSASARGRSGSRKRSASKDTDDTDATLAEGGASSPRTYSPDKHPALRGARSLATPEPSVREKSSVNSLLQSPTDTTSVQSKGQVTRLDGYAHPMNMQTAVGVLVLSVAAAAVIWRVKPEA